VETFYTDGRTVTPYHTVSCRLPLSPRHAQSTQPQYTWNVSIANNNRSFSNERRMFVYDSKCLECPNNGASSCRQKVYLRVSSFGGINDVTLRKKHISWLKTRLIFTYKDKKNVAKFRSGCTKDTDKKYPNKSPCTP